MMVYRTAVRYKLIKSKRGDEKRSFCDYCGRQLHWYENVPVVSWLMQKGKTRCCGKRLPYSYPVVELLTGLLFFVVFKRFDLGFKIYDLRIILEFLIVTMLVFEAEFDRRYMILPDFGIGVLCVGAILLAIIGRPLGSPVQNIIGAAAGSFGFLLLLHLITKGKGMGMGDVKLALFMGLFLGFPKVIIAFYAAFIVGAIYGLYKIIFDHAGRKSLICFGPFLILGTLIAWWCGDQILKVVKLL